ncbi:esterase EstB [Aspergillus udagawae]|uniref:Esterase EstB n=1 Tax=Aspergillus udagawae TaxID=91492 RepID=A0A8H3P5V1_9EURO|nr:esterase EstB [Aspergillus udagawae]
MAEPSLLPPLGQITPNNHGAIVSLFTFIFLSSTGIVVLAKIALMVYLKRSVPSVDIPIWICMVVALVQSILIQVAVNYGMGRRRSEVSNDSFDTYNKINYAAEFLLLLVLALSKVSTGNLIRSISPSNSIRRWCLMAHIGVGVWTLLALFGTAFQCPDPYWEYSPSRCIGKGAIIYPIMVLNMVLDAALVILPIVMLWNVQMPRIQRLKVSSAFASRSLAMMNLSIIAACIPSLYRVITSLALGMNTVHMFEGTELSSAASSKKPNSHSTPKTFRSSRSSRRRESTLISNISIVTRNTDREESTESTRRMVNQP